MRNLRQALQLKAYEFTMKDGRTFTAYGVDEQEAIDELNDYLFCEYGEQLNPSMIEHVEVFNKH